MAQEAVPSLTIDRRRIRRSGSPFWARPRQPFSTPEELIELYEDRVRSDLCLAQVFGAEGFLQPGLALLAHTEQLGEARRFGTFLHAS